MVKRFAPLVLEVEVEPGTGRIHRAWVHRFAFMPGGQIVEDGGAEFHGPEAKAEAAAHLRHILAREAA